MIANLRRLVIWHVVLGLASIFAYMTGPGAIARERHTRGPVIALMALFKVLFAWTPYIISGFYSCNVLAERNPRATLAFIWCAIGVGIFTDCLILDLFGTTWHPAPWLLFIALTIALIAIARICAIIWPSVETG